MKVVKKSSEYTISQRRDGRYAVVNSSNAPVNGEEKVKILVAEELIKLSTAAPAPEPEAEEGPFLKEERDLIANLANIISGYLNSIKGKAFLRRYGYEDEEFRLDQQKEQCVITNRQLLQRFLNKNNYDRDVYHDLMPFKVREILIIANLYDAYSIEKEGRFSEHMMGAYAQLNLTYFPGLPESQLKKRPLSNCGRNILTW